ncbi:MAG: adenylate/guanylate cyclase domain-containing protein [Syntrophales bacterium]|nr:adenylate/guanylate cyclase domain-containing protein [Syntrophales bacterium]
MKNAIKNLFVVSPFKIAVMVIFMMVFFYFLRIPFFNFMELKTLDLRFVSRGVVSPGSETVIAAIDEKSLSELGRWPWRRTVIAELINRLDEYGVKAIGFDIVFAEPDEHGSLDALQSVARDLELIGMDDHRVLEVVAGQIAAADTDAVLARAIEDAGKVTLGYFFYTSERDAAHLSEEALAAGAESLVGSQYQAVRFTGTPNKVFTIHAFAAAANIPVLSEVAENSGFFNAIPDVDGTNRWAPMVIGYDDTYFPSLSLATLMVYRDWPLLAMRVSDLGVDQVVFDETVIPVDSTGRMLINYRGPGETFPHYSISDIIQGSLDPELFSGKIVLVGATATGIYDLRVTPFSTVYPGIEIHANVIDNILREDFLKRPDWTYIADMLPVLILGFIMVPFLSRMKALFGLIFTLVLVSSYIFFNLFLFTEYNLWLNMVYPVITILLVYVGITLYRYITEEREKKKIRGAFQYYLTESVINEMLKDPDKLKLGGDKKDLTVLFSDIRGFTSISEMLSPEDLVHLLNEYLTAMTDKVFKQEGLLDKYMGDAIMAVYGAPLDQPDHALRACRTALDMMDAMKVLQAKWTEEGKPVLDIGIGINTGDMVVGNMGSEMRFDYTVMGDSVNLGSRLEGINKEYGTNIVISEFTYEKIKDQLQCRELDQVQVKGKNRPVKIYELLGPLGDSGHDYSFLPLFEKGLSMYRQCQWDSAIESFENVLEIKPGDFASQMYIDRCKELRGNPPESGWDCVFRMTKK